MCPPSVRRPSLASAGIWFNSLSSSPTVGTVSGSNSSTKDGLTGTQTRPKTYRQRSNPEQDGFPLTCPWMNAKWRLEEMISVFGHFRIDTRIRILEDDILQPFFKSPLHRSVIVYALHVLHADSDWRTHCQRRIAFFERHHDTPDIIPSCLAGLIRLTLPFTPKCADRIYQAVSALLGETPRKDATVEPDGIHHVPRSPGSRANNDSHPVCDLKHS